MNELMIVLPWLAGVGAVALAVLVWVLARMSSDCEQWEREAARDRQGDQ